VNVVQSFAVKLGSEFAFGRLISTVHSFNKYRLYDQNWRKKNAL